MDQKVNPKRAYRSPQITKIILRREQAILSACDTSAGLMATGVLVNCRIACRRTDSSGNFAAPPS